MKTLRRILLIIIALVVVLLVIGFILPGKSRVERSLVIKAPAEVIFNQVNTLKNWEKWSPWHKIDTLMKITYSGPDAGNGAAYTWQGNKSVGSGKLEIIHSVFPDSIIMLMDFEENGKSEGKFLFAPADSGIKVTWILESDMGRSPINRWFGLLLRRMVGKDFEAGLENIAESVKHEVQSTFEVKELQIPERLILSITDTATLGTFQQKMQAMMMKLVGFMKQKNVNPSGAPIAIYHDYSPQGFRMEVAMPVEKNMPGNKEINCSKLAEVKTVKVEYFGEYSKMIPVYETLQKYIADHNLTIAGAPWEEYITNPTVEPDTSKWQTNVYFPVK